MKTFNNRLLELFLVQKGNCFYCGKPMDSHGYPSRKNGYTRDHLFPKRNGNELDNNKVLAHFKCNKKKGGREPTGKEIHKYNNLILRLKKRKTVIYGGKR